MTTRAERLALHRATESRMQKAARRVDKTLPDGVCFAIVTFVPNPDGGTSYAGYVSNAQRSDMISALRECADTLEARRDVAASDDIPEVH